jgi:anti-sigma B factor antagonist
MSDPYAGAVFGIEVDLVDEPVVRLRGDLDASTVPQLHAYAVRLLDCQPARLVIDVEELDFIDSTGLGMLVTLFKRLRHRGGHSLVVRAPSPTTMSILEVTGLDKLFTVERVGEAVHAR